MLRSTADECAFAMLGDDTKCPHSHVANSPLTRISNCPESASHATRRSSIHCTADRLSSMGRRFHHVHSSLVRWLPSPSQFLTFRTFDSRAIPVSPLVI
ncbi:MAG: hypothetical protein FWD57_12340 [Polyangiaceae bacterium]|nr:hypothetical protein [Polyangiaceae bacterium]